LTYSRLHLADSQNHGDLNPAKDVPPALLLGPPKRKVGDDLSSRQEKNHERSSTLRKFKSKSFHEQQEPARENKTVLRTVSSSDNNARLVKSDLKSGSFVDVIDVVGDVPKRSPPPWLAIAMEKQRRWGREESV